MTSTTTDFVRLQFARVVELLPAPASELIEETLKQLSTAVSSSSTPHSSEQRAILANLLGSKALFSPFLLIYLLPLLTYFALYKMSWWPSASTFSPFSYLGAQDRATCSDDAARADHSAAPTAQKVMAGAENAAKRPTGPLYSFPKFFGSGYHPEAASSEAAVQSGSAVGAASSRSGAKAKLTSDQIILRHRGTAHPLRFPAYSIENGEVFVSDLRRSAALELKVANPRRVKLLFKGRQLRNDSSSLVAEGLGHDIEVMCVVTTDVNFGDSDDEEAPGLYPKEIDSSSNAVHQRKRKGHRGGGKKKKASANASPGPEQDLRQEHINLPSNARLPIPTSVPSTSSPSIPARQPSTPAQALATIRQKLENEFIPVIRNYIESPPQIEKDRKFEYKRLSEGVLQQILLKTDGIEVAGDETLRAQRKLLVRQAQDLLKKLDESNASF